ncbi:hypothetical protein HDV57DRAFT_241838 [Trichoderma longibrachiatum]
MTFLFVLSTVRVVYTELRRRECSPRLSIYSIRVVVSGAMTLPAEQSGSTNPAVSEPTGPKPANLLLFSRVDVPALLQSHGLVVYGLTRSTAVHCFSMT